MTYQIPYKFEMKGDVEIIADSYDEALKALDRMLKGELIDNANFVEGSLGVEGKLFDKRR